MSERSDQDKNPSILPDSLREIADQITTELAIQESDEGALRDLLASLHERGYEVIQPDSRTVSGQEAESSRDSEIADARSQAEEFLRKGEPLIAFNIADRCLTEHGDDLRLRQLSGLALARSGAMEKANSIFRALANEGHDDGETLGILGRTHKDLAVQSRDPGAREAHLEAAFNAYEQAYLAATARGNAGEIYYTGINAATVGVLLGDASRSFQIASHVHEVCSRELESQGEDSGGAYWLQATLGEASLIQGKVGEAKKHYGRAAVLAGSRFGDLASTRRQARLLLKALGQDPSILDSTLTVPGVLVYSGHMVDAPDRPSTRFPPSLEKAVADEIRRHLDRLQPAAAYGSAACGADILILEAMLERGAEIHIVLPFPVDDFRKVSVEIGAGTGWGHRFDRVIEAASSLTFASDHYARGSTSTFHYANLILTGMAELRSRTLETDLQPLAVWDGGPAGGLGGTASLVEHWRESGHEVEHIDVRRLAGLEALAATSPGSREPQHLREGLDEPFAHVIRSLLFADATGYSKLTEDQIPAFVEHFMGAIAKLTRASDQPPLLMETAGDGLYYVFAEPQSAADFGLALSSMINRTDWSHHGLPKELNMRVALHCGPVYTCIDPVTELRKYTGPHTSRTARIEPVTPPGQVYASSAFAAVAAAKGVHGLRFDYIGHTSLAKKYGALALYHVGRED